MDDDSTEYVVPKPVPSKDPTGAGWWERWIMLLPSTGLPGTSSAIREGVCISEVFADLLHRRNVKPCFGAVGKHGSIAVTERVILMLKYGWLKRVPVIRDLDHMSQLLRDFEVYYNEYRGHATLDGTRLTVAGPRRTVSGKQVQDMSRIRAWSP